MSVISHRILESNGIRIHVAEQGEGPLVLLCHGFPEGWYSWRHQLEALAAAGFRAVAPDMRGYGETVRPPDVASYTLLHLVGDMVGLVAALGTDRAVIVGHDWGAPVAWHAALLRPDLFRGVVGLSVPFRPRVAVRPTSVMPRRDGAIFYQLYFQQPGVAEAELERDVRTTMRTVLCSGFGEGQPRETLGMVYTAKGILGAMSPPSWLPAWLSDSDLDHYVAAFKKTGFGGGLNWYRNIDRNWELLAPFAGAKITVPALYIHGDRDIVPRFPGADRVIADLPNQVPGLRDILRLADCGHWTQQEQPAKVNAALIDFLKKL
ncbi:MAG: alpha/beta hydrolase fold protein [Rhodospirillales bacterium]|jgi:pimeloyl-ACP methyl ester carboxylesterase|nr:alpha/beta hydrolase fold protein [Rhodospirillales bacterium]